MFIGHYALGLASRRNTNLPSLAMMFIAVQFLDLIWPIFVLLGIETVEIQKGNTVLTPLHFTSYPYSHSLLMAIFWGIVLGLIYLAITKNKQGALWLSILVFSHWVLDFLVHAPDLQIAPFIDARVGLGMWNYPAVEIILEFALFALGTYWYYQAIKPQRKVSFWLLISLFAVIHTLNIVGPPPPQVSAVAWSANLMWLFVLWAWWIEKKKV